jgi:hypothetical protein
MAMDEDTLRRVVREEFVGDTLRRVVREEFEGDALRRVVREVVRGEVHTVREEVHAVRDELHTVRDELRSEIAASEARLAEGGKLQFRQLAELYRSLVVRMDHLEKHHGDRFDATRGAIEALRSSLERQDFRSDELGRRLTTLETRPRE